MSPPRLRDLGQELYELGAKGTAFRVAWEISRRAGLSGTKTMASTGGVQRLAGPAGWVAHLPFADPLAVADAVRDRTSPEALQHLRQTAERATRGEIECFGRWTASFGDPIDWHRNPMKGTNWPERAPSWRALDAQANVGDVKLSWEVARFPHAYQLARAAAFFPEQAPRFSAALASQVLDFVTGNPAGSGIHWASGQEIAFRLLAWLFAADTLFGTWNETEISATLEQAMVTGAAHIESNLNYARFAVYNNHLLSEALALFAVGALLPNVRVARRWRELGRRILDEESEQQFYGDGAYIQQSHTYHRVALLDLLWACAFTRSMGDRPSAPWLAAMERSIHFLVAHQNEATGELPNYGSNDGSLPGIFSTCDFADFRPILQTANVLVHGRRLYEPGPWDEMVAWFLGPIALDVPLAPPPRNSVSFGETGYHVLRGMSAGNYGAFRCGTLRDRFSQIDMLHLDVWWRGLNVLVDAGSYLYNDRPEWHEHFMRTGCHNTLMIDGIDQMLHFRQFKVLYRTEATLSRFEDNGEWTACEGRHLGYRRQPGNCAHDRSILFLKDDLWIVVDRVTGDGRRAIRLHWLGGDFPASYETAVGELTLSTPEGAFFVRVLDASGNTLSGDVVAGVESPPRGWLSRYYGEKVAVPSLAVQIDSALPFTFVSVLSGGRRPTIGVAGERWTIDLESRSLRFGLADGRLSDVTVERSASAGISTGPCTP